VKDGDMLSSELLEGAFTRPALKNLARTANFDASDGRLSES